MDTMGTNIAAAGSKVIKLFYNLSGQLEQEQVKSVCNILKNKGVIAVPTDTLYGIAARAQDSEALERIYTIKGRNRNKPLAICIAATECIDEVARDIDDKKRNLLKQLLPGPVTVVLKRSEQLNKDLNPGLDTIGVRVPNHNFIRTLCHMVGPLALTSANRSGESSPLIIQDFEDLWGELDAVYDCGLLQKYIEGADPGRSHRLGSTVVDLTGENTYKIIRKGLGCNRAINTLNYLGFKCIKTASSRETGY